MQEFKLSGRPHLYHVTVPSRVDPTTRFVENVSAFGFDIHDGCLIFYQAHGPDLAYAPGQWFTVVTSS